MGIYKPANSPNYHYDFQFRGVRYHGSTGCRSKVDARAFEAKVRSDAALRKRVRPTITVDQACGAYQDKVEELRSWPTMRYILRALVKGLGASTQLDDVTQRDLQTYFKKRQAGLSAASVNREVENARAVWRNADTLRYEIGEMPNWRALRLKCPKKPPRELSFEEEDRLFSALRIDVSDAVEFALKSGWRRNEVLDLKWSDCDFEHRQAMTRLKGGEVVMRPLSDALLAIIQRQPRICAKVFTYVCQKSRGDRRKGQRYPLTATSLRKPFEAAMEAAAIDNCRLHDLRHTRATRIVRATGSLAAAKEALKHKSINTTLQYAHVMDEDLRRALELSESRNSPEAK